MYSYCVAEGDASHCFAELGRFDEATLHARRALEFAEKVGNLVLRAFHEAHLGFIAMRQGDYHNALKCADGWLRTYGNAELFLPWQVMASRLGPIFNFCDRIPDAIALFEKAHQFAQSNNLVGFLQPELAWLAHAYSRAGRAEEAINLGQRALDLARQYGQRGNEAWTLYVIAEIYAALPQQDMARESYRQARVLAAELGLRPLEGQCLLRIGRLASGLGDCDEGKQQISKACRMFREMGIRTGSDQSEIAS